ncbi:flippase-like domain-containing protein [Candidatus Woesearchaeota archaeon]|nr:flippase-like domain-containing protein [Candidatus Woesearchaeota archaeon]
MKINRNKIAAELISVLIGVVIFTLVLKIAGFGNIIGSIKSFSPLYLVAYILVALATTHWAAAFRWKFVLLSEGVNVPVWTLFKYKAIIFGLNYLTPVARIGGEPLKVLLLKRQHIRTSKSIASVVIDNFLGMGIDVLLAGVILLALVFTAATLSSHLKGVFLAAGLTFPILVTLVFLLLKKKKGPFSSLLRAIGAFANASKKPSFVRLSRKIARSEYYMRTLLVKRPRNMLFACIYAAMSWPLTVIQYKLALLMLGIDASLIQLLISVMMINITLLVPIPGALGIQEAGQFSIFRLLSGNPHAGIALSLVLRFKDLILLLISFILVSMEGASLYKLFSKKASALLGKEKQK